MTEVQILIRGRRILVVEDVYLIASELADQLEESGLEVIGPARCVEDALDILSGTTVDGAVLDINLQGQPAYRLADLLRERGVPFVFATGYDASTIPDAYADVPRLEKPVDARALARTFSQMKE